VNFQASHVKRSQFQRSHFKFCLLTLLLWACQPQATLVPPNPPTNHTQLTPSSKGERLTPSSKGERRGPGRLSGQILLAGPWRIQQTFQQSPQQAVPRALLRIEGTDLQTYSDAEGRFNFDNLPLDEDLVLQAEKANADGKSFKLRRPLRLAATQPSLDLSTLFLKETGSLTGQVSVSDQNTGLGSPAAVDVYLPGTTFVAKTDKEGNFALPDLPEGKYRLSAYKAGYGLVESNLLDVKAGSVTPVPNLELSPVATPRPEAKLAGRLTSAGQPLAHAQIALIGQDLSLSRLTLSDAQGLYQIGGILLPEGLTSGKYTLLVSRPFYPPLLTEIELKAGQSHNLDLNLPEQSLTLGRLAVQVKDCSGAPVPLALLQLDPAPALNQTTFVDSLGQAQLSRLLPGQYTVYAAKGQRRTFAGVLIDNLQTGSDQKPGALARINLVLGSPCQ
jgi:hypothetical protein